MHDREDCGPGIIFLLGGAEIFVKPHHVRMAVDKARRRPCGHDRIEFTLRQHFYQGFAFRGGAPGQADQKRAEADLRDIKFLVEIGAMEQFFHRHRDIVDLTPLDLDPAVHDRPDPVIILRRYGDV